MDSEARFNARIDYQAAAERLLVALSTIGLKRSAMPIPSGRLAGPVFGTAARHWSHETRRRRIRDAVTVARSQIQSNDQKIQIVANGQGYWLTGDTDVLLWYASKRRHRGLGDLAAAGRTRKLAVTVNQPDLFGAIKSEFRH